MKLQFIKTKPLEGFSISEYLLVIEPNESLCEEIIALREKFYQQFKIDKPVNKRVQIVLANFFQYEIAETKIIAELKHIISHINPALIELNGFGSFPTHTIYLNMESKQTLKELTKTIRTSTQLLMKLNDENKPHFINEPYFIVAQKIMPWQYEKAWLQYGRKHFSRKFIATGVTLLKRCDEKRILKIVNRFQLGNATVAKNKPLLFNNIS